MGFLCHLLIDVNYCNRLLLAFMPLSPEIYARIVNHIRVRRELVTLCLVNKAFQRAAETRLYHSLNLSSFMVVFQIYEALKSTSASENPRGSYVRECTLLDSLSDRTMLSTMPHSGAEDIVLERLRRSLTCMPNLEVLNLWHLSIDGELLFKIPEEFPFRLQQISLRIDINEQVAKFLESQKQSVRYLALLADDLWGKSLPELDALEHIEGPISFVSCCLDAPFTHVQTWGNPHADRDTGYHSLSFQDSMTFVRQLARGKGATLVSLSIQTMDISMNEAEQFFAFVADSFPNLRYFGQMILPDTNRALTFNSLARLHHLTDFEADITGWLIPLNPRTVHLFALEFRIYRPTLRRVSILNDRARYICSWSPQLETFSLEHEVKYIGKGMERPQLWRHV